jgi:hypothetical protein
MDVKGFNTGRLYQKDGQKISYAIAEDGEALFNDHSRGIWGTVGQLPDWVLTDSQKQRVIHERYLQGKYQFDPRADKLNAGDWPMHQL